MHPKLSVLVISHNQEHLLPRCLDSILGQKLTCSYEVIVSDDASTDNTWTVIQNYASRYPQLRGVQTDSNDYYIAVPSERGSINKLNAYAAARGEYVVFVDGDDYLLSDDIYQLQVEQLDAHPECFLCRQNMTLAWDGDSEEKWWKWENKRPTGYIMSPQEYISLGMMSCPAFMIRKHPDFCMDGIFHTQCYDEFITYQYLQWGPIVCVDRADYMYVQYHKSILHSYEADSMAVRYAVSVLLYMYLIPMYEKAFYEAGLKRLVNFMKKTTTRDLVVADNMKAYLNRFDGFIFQYMSEDKHSFIGRLRLWMIRVLQIVQIKLFVDSDLMRRLIFSLYTKFGNKEKLVIRI